MITHSYELFTYEIYKINIAMLKLDNAQTPKKDLASLEFKIPVFIFKVR